MGTKESRCRENYGKYLGCCSVKKYTGVNIGPIDLQAEQAVAKNAVGQAATVVKNYENKRFKPAYNRIFNTILKATDGIEDTEVKSNLKELVEQVKIEGRNQLKSRGLFNLKSSALGQMAADEALGALKKTKYGPQKLKAMINRNAKNIINNANKENIEASLEEAQKKFNQAKIDVSKLAG